MMPSHTNFKFLTVLACFYSLSCFSIELPPLFSDHMVLQRDKSILVQGKAVPDSQVTLTIAEQQHQVLSDRQGNWTTTIQPMDAGGPYVLTAKDNQSEVKVVDVYFGDVWLASGQSNMEWKLKWQVDNWHKEVADSDYSLIRYFDVPNHYTATEQKRPLGGQWQLASPQTSGNFSAVAWFFAKHLHLDKQVPVAIIDSTWGGTPAEAWTPLSSLSSLPGYRDAASKIAKNAKEWDKTFATTRESERQKQARLNSLEAHLKFGVSNTEYNDSNWHTSSLPLSHPLPNILWARKAFTLDRLQQNDTAYLSLGYMPSHVQVYVNGVAIKKAAGAQKNDPFVVLPGTLKEGKNSVAVRVGNGWNNLSNFGSNGQMKLSLADLTIDMQHNWKINNEVEDAVPMPAKHWQTEGVLYNAMIHPLLDYPLKGVIWYQGESNIDRAGEYADLFSTLIKSWRQKWAQPDLPFIYAQLASMHAQRSEPMDSQWAELRDAQTQTLVLPHTAMAVLIDAGEAWDIHPRNKQIVGDRMWRAANAIAYQSGEIYAGPEISEMTVQNQTLTLSFVPSGSALTKRGNRLLGFELAGRDGRYVTAEAEIVGNQVRVHAEQIDMPVSVRYGWADNSPANLYNQAGLPAVPFRLGE